jgi:hypothetical protein
MIYKSSELSNKKKIPCGHLQIFAHDTPVYRTNPNSNPIRQDPSYHLVSPILYTRYFGLRVGGGGGGGTQFCARYSEGNRAVSLERSVVGTKRLTCILNVWIDSQYLAPIRPVHLILNTRTCIREVHGSNTCLDYFVVSAC